MKKDVKIINLKNGEVYPGVVWEEKKASVYVLFRSGANYQAILPFSKKTGKRYGKDKSKGKVNSHYALKIED